MRLRPFPPPSRLPPEARRYKIPPAAEIANMLSLFDPRPTHHCQGYSRREFLRVGSLGLGGLTLPNLLGRRASAASPSYVRRKSVVLLFLQGGAPHIEFFDPKMSAPVEIRSVSGELQTKLPGVTFGGTFPKLAERADRFTIVRSYGSGNSGHTYNDALSGRNGKGPVMSSIYSRVCGTNHPQTGLPTNILVLPEAVSDGKKWDRNFETGALPTLTQSGELGAAYSAFDPSGGGDLQKDMELRLSPEKLADRRELLHSLDRLRRRTDVSSAFAGLETYEQQAFDVLLRGAAEAFDLTKEDPRTIERYDTERLFNMQELTRWYDMRRASNLLGRQMLLARRLVEAGCGFVTVSDCGWDYHANGNSPKNMGGLPAMGGQVDHAVSTFLDDLRERGLSDDVLLIVTSEMGRSPRINKNGGRDHYGELTSLLLAGGGLKMGQVLGQTDEFAAQATTDPFRPEHLLATVMHTLFDVAQLRLDRSLPSQVIKLSETGTPISGLM